MTLELIDISYWQTTTPSLSGIDGVVIRATYNTSRDTRYWMHSNNVAAAGKPQGAYAFGTCHSPGSDQAKALIAAIGTRTRMVALDVESETHREILPDGSVRSYSDIMSETQGRDFIATMHAAGYFVGLYHSLSGFPEWGQDWDWVAQWGVSAPSRHCLIWQRGAAGSNPQIDHNTFYGTLDQLRAMTTADRRTPPDSSTTGGDVDPRTDSPIATADYRSGSSAYANIGDATPVISSWPGGRGVGVFARRLRPDGVPMNLVRIGSSGADYQALWVGEDKASNFVLTPAVPAAPAPPPDCTAAVTAAVAKQKATDDAALAAYKAEEATRTAAAIATDRTKAHVVVSYD